MIKSPKPLKRSFTGTPVVVPPRTQTPQQIELLTQYLAQKPTSHFQMLSTLFPDLVTYIFSFLPTKTFFTNRMLNKRCKGIIDNSLINSSLAQDNIQFPVRNVQDQQALFLSQQTEIDSLLENKSTILRTPKWESNIVRPDEELIKAFETIKRLPADNSVFSLYRRHAALEDINLHIIFNSRNPDQICKMVLSNFVVDLSGLALTRVPSDFFNLFLDRRLFLSVKVFTCCDNHLSHLPRSILCLRRLQLLNASGNHIQSLPENMNDFEHLETVLLANNCLKELPIGVVKLRALKQLDIRRNCLQTLPEELEESKIVRSRAPSAELSIPNIQSQQYFGRLTMCPMKKAALLATQKRQNEVYLRHAMAKLRI